MVFVYRVKSMDPICFCNYVFLSWLLYVILYWSLSVLSCWDSFCLLCIKQLSSNDTRVNNILRMLVVWWAIITTNCEICIPCPHMPCPSEYFLSPTGQQVTAVLGHQILLWETAFYYDMADDWSKNQLWNWLIRSSNCLSQYTPLSTWSSLSNFHTLSIFLAIYASEMINPLCKHCASSISIFIVSVQEFLCSYWRSKCFQKTGRWFWRQQNDLYLFWFFDKIILAWFTKSEFIAYSHVFQVIVKLKYRFMKN